MDTKQANGHGAPTRTWTTRARVIAAAASLVVISGAPASAAQIVGLSGPPVAAQRFDPISRILWPIKRPATRIPAGRRSWINQHETPVVWFATGVGNTVDSYNVNGRMVGSIGGLNEPLGVSIDKRGYIYVSNTLASQVLIYKPGATVPTLTLDDAGFLPVSVAINEADGTIAVANACSGDPVNRCTGNGNTVLYKKGATKPSVTLNGIINLPYSVAYDAYGKLWEVGFENRSPNGQTPLAGYYGHAGKTFTLFAIPLFLPVGIGFDGAGNVDILDGAVSPCPSDPSFSCAIFSIYKPNSNVLLSSFPVGQSQSDFVSGFALDKAAGVMWATDAFYATNLGLLYAYPSGWNEITHTIVFSPTTSPVGVAVKP